MKIAFSGVQGCGKTTLINEIQKWNFFKDYVFCTGTVRQFLKDGMKINQSGDENTQYLIMLAHTLNFMHENVVADRSFLDEHSYALWSLNHHKIPEYTFNISAKMFDAFVPKYDYIFFMEPEFDIIPDGVRSLDKTFRNEVANYFRNLATKYSNIVKITGSVQQRLNQIKNILKI